MTWCTRTSSRASRSTGLRQRYPASSRALAAAAQARSGLVGEDSRLAGPHCAKRVPVELRAQTIDDVARALEIHVCPVILAEQRIAPAHVERIAAVKLEVRHLPLAHLQRQSAAFHADVHGPEQWFVVPSSVFRERPRRRCAAAHG